MAWVFSSPLLFNLHIPILFLIIESKIDIALEKWKGIAQRNNTELRSRSERNLSQKHEGQR